MPKHKKGARRPIGMARCSAHSPAHESVYSLHAESSCSAFGLKTGREKAMTTRCEGLGSSPLPLKRRNASCRAWLTWGTKTPLKT